MVVELEHAAEALTALDLACVNPIARCKYSHPSSCLALIFVLELAETIATFYRRWYHVDPRFQSAVDRSAATDPSCGEAPAEGR